MGTIARFHIKKSFRVSLRSNEKSLVLAGEIVDGIINIGDYIVFQYDNHSFRRLITQVEFADFNVGREDFFAYIALVIEDNDHFFDVSKIENQAVDIFNSF